MSEDRARLHERVHEAIELSLQDSGYVASPRLSRAAFAAADAALAASGAVTEGLDVPEGWHVVERRGRHTLIERNEPDVSARLSGATDRPDRLREALASEIAGLERPGGLHDYSSGYHASPCAACQMLARLRAALSEPET